MRNLLWLLILLTGTAQAEVYFGLGGSLAIVDVETNCGACSEYNVQKTSIKPTAFIGYRGGSWAIETGIGYAAYRGHAVMPERPADVRQDIDSRFLYLSGMRFIALAGGEMFVGAGASQVSARNHEHGLNRDDSTSVPAHYMENHTSTKEIAPYFQVGYQYGPVRVGVSFIPNVVRSHWTGSEDIYNVSASYVWRFK